MIVDWEDGNRPGGLVVLWSRAADLLNRHYRLDPAVGPITIGRLSDNAIVLDGDGVSRLHARIEHRSDGWWVVDAGSMNGTQLNDAQVTEARLALGDRLHIGSSVILKVVGDTWPPKVDRDYRPDSAIDGLTGLRNKRCLFWRLGRELQHPERASRRVSLAMFDLDHFKRLNDAFGYLAGDQVLREVGSVLNRLEEGSDVVVRYGGEELVWLMFGKDLAEAAKRAESARALIESRDIGFEQHTMRTTVSVGVAQLDERLLTPEDFVRRADEQLYKAKCAGRNCVRW